MKAAIRAILALTVLCAGCGGNNTTTAPAATSTSTAGTDTFSTFLAVGGSSGHAFAVSAAGTITITLTSVTPSAVVGLGVGIPGQGTSLCSLSSSVDATAGTTAQLTVPVDAGTYCVQVYDSGHVMYPGVAFSVTIVHP
ncbi:MAG: hypothetical protein Q7J25_13695 [Vicinamibacterales bacterium]|nr:hypothetical protein [Vicinamibacterales bacterium]